MCLLVCLATGNRLCELFGLGDLGLEGCDPAITLGKIGSLEGVLVAMNCEIELNSSFVCGLGRVGLERTYCQNRFEVNAGNWSVGRGRAPLVHLDQQF